MSRNSKQARSRRQCVRIPLLSLKLQIWHLLRARSSLTFRPTIEFRFTLKLVRDMIMTYSQMHRTDKYSQHSWIIWPVWPNGWVFVYELSGCGFESCCSHLNFRFRTCFKQEVPWHSTNYRVWIHSETRMWHDKNIQYRSRDWRRKEKSTSKEIVERTYTKIFGPTWIEGGGCKRSQKVVCPD